jgi:hypothetical protein
MTPLSPSYGIPSRGVSYGGVSQAADALLRAGERPTTRNVRVNIGGGSPNTIGPLLDEWWRRLASRLDAGPAAFHRLPEAVAQVAESLWTHALEESRRRVLQEQQSTDRLAAMDKERLDLRAHVLTLREGEMEARIQDRTRTVASLETRLQLLTGMLQKEQASRESVTRRLLRLESELRTAREPKLAKPARKRSRNHRPPIAKRARPAKTRKPKSRR